MANILDYVIANKTINPTKQGQNASFTFDSDGKIKPLKDKGKLLPSRIFASPVEYAKDLKQDVLNIGKAAKGKANDHELGRINDLAMKFGSLCLAGYLFIKNPLKLSKTMEFVGFGSFFASMALWPKLFIQAPLKSRTGVDIHQKYIDSQNRKKMLHQDPQYDLTDLYSRKDLDLMGEKLGVSRNIPDRDNFIKQRAKKTAVQGNTLWMATAGFATPIMSGLICNRLEKPVAKLIEEYDLISSSIKMKQGVSNGPVAKLKQYFNQRALNKFIQQNADKPMDDKLITDLAFKLGGKVNAASFLDAIKNELKLIKTEVKIDENFVRNALGDKLPKDIFSKMTAENRAIFDEALAENSIGVVSNVLTITFSDKRTEQVKFKSTIDRLFRKALKEQETPKLSDVSDKIQSMYSSISSFAAEKRIIDKYVDARIGDKAGTYIANQWGRVGNRLIKSLRLNTEELKALSLGKTDILIEKIAKLASDDLAYDKAVDDLMKLIGDFESKTSETFFTKIKQKSKDIFGRASNVFKEKGFKEIAEMITSEYPAGTLENSVNIYAKERVTGARSSLYRLLQSMDIIKKAKEGILEQQLIAILRSEGQAVDKETLSKLIAVCQKVILRATTTDHVEKLMSSGYELSTAEYKVVMRALFDNSTDTSNTLEKSLSKIWDIDRAQEMLKGFKEYKDEFMSKVANWQNGMTPELSRRTVTGATHSANAIERNNLVGKPIHTYIQDIAKQSYNSQKWLKIFGTAFAALALITLTIGLTFGRKSKIEKQLEEESKVKYNG